MTGVITQRLRDIAQDIARYTSQENDVKTQEYHANLGTHRRMEKLKEQGKSEYSGSEPEPPNMVIVDPDVLTAALHEIVMAIGTARETGEPGIPGITVKPLVQYGTTVEGTEMKANSIFPVRSPANSSQVNERGEVEVDTPSASRG